MPYRPKTDPEDYESAKDYEKEHGPVDPYDPYAPKKKKSIGRRIFEILGISLIVFVYAFWIIRINLAEDPSQARKFVWTESRIAAYEADPDGYAVYTQKLDGRIDKDGRVMLTRLFVDYNTGSVQFTVRYSDSTAEKALAAVEYAEKRARMNMVDKRIAQILEDYEEVGLSIKELQDKYNVSRRRVFQLLACAREIGQEA